MLALVVGGATAEQLLAFLHQRPGADAAAPLRIETADHVAMTIGEQCFLRAGLATFGNQERAAVGRRVLVDRAGEAQRLQRGAHLAVEIGTEIGGAIGILAFGRDGDAAGEIGGETALVKIIGSGLDGGSAGHGRSEEHTSELQSLMRKSYAVFCLKKKKTHKTNKNNKQIKETKRTTNDKNNHQ